DEEAEEIERRITENVVKLAATDQLNSEIVTNKSRAYLSCESGEMIVKINFTEPFRGIGYSDYDRTSPCKFYGDGSTHYQMRLPLKGCGTKQEAPRLFINNIILRFHRTLELEEDEIKTIVCRYPPPLAPPPPSISAPILEPPPVPILPIPAKLSESELLLIISALLFLTLLLLGIGMAYYCLKRRNIKVVRKRKIVPEMSKITTIEPVRIPRVAVSTSSSDYPSSSEEISVISDTSTIRRDHYNYENQAFIPEPYPLDIEREDSVTSLPVPVMAKPNITQLDLLTTIRETQHLTDTDIFNTKHFKTTTQLYRKAPTPTASSIYGSIPDNDMWSYSELDDTPEQRPYIPPPKLHVRNIDDSYVSTQHITDIDEDITTHRRITQPNPKITSKTTYDLYLSPEEVVDTSEDITTKRLTVYPKPKITIKSTEDYYVSPQEITDITEDTTTQRITTYPKPRLTTQTLDDYFRTDRETTEVLEDTSTTRAIALPPKGPAITDLTQDDRFINMRETTEITDTSTRQLIKHPTPKYTVHTIDDTFITNICETETIEHITANDKKDTFVSQPPSQPRLGPGPDWEVQINRYLVGPTTELPDTKTTTTTSQLYDSYTSDRLVDTTDQRTSTSIQHISSRETKIDMIYKVLNAPPPDLPGVDTLSPAVKQKLRSIITTDEVFRTLIIESNTTEKYIHISRHIHYSSLFEPPVWHTIVQLFSLPEVLSAPKLPPQQPLQPLQPPQPSQPPQPPPTNRYRRKTSLPLISSEQLVPESFIPPESIRSRRASRSSSIFDVRSLTEEDVTFARSESIRFPQHSLTAYQHSDQRSQSYIYSQSQPTDHPTDRPTTSGRQSFPYIPRATHVSPLLEASHRPYSPDIDALSLATPSDAYTSSRYMSSYGRSTAYGRLAQIRRTLDRTTSVGEKEETKSVSEKDVYDWKR
ncbi:unnamed protein product, partial [Medioppia subpectinata]